MSKLYTAPEGKPSIVEFHTTEERRKQLSKQLIFAEERSPALMQNTLILFESCYKLIEPSKLRFDNFDYESKSAFEIVVRIVPSSNRFELIRKTMEKKGLIEQTFGIKSFEDNALEATIEYKERAEQLVEVLVAHAAKDLGPRPGGRAFVRWLLQLLGLLEPRGQDKQEWLEQRNEFIDSLAYDYARYGLTPHAEIQNLPNAFLTRFNNSYKAACAQYGKNTKPHNPFIRKWIALRKSALVRGRSFDAGITPEVLQNIATTEYCPVTGVLLEVSALDEYSCEDNRWSVERQCNELGYTSSNITLTSNKVNKIRGSLNGFEIFERAAGVVVDERLTRIQWCRLANLHKYACSYAEPYLCNAFYPIAWCNLSVVENEIAEDAGSVVGLIAEAKKQLNGFPVTESYLRDFARKDPAFSSWPSEKLNFAVGKLYSVVRQQMKNDHRQALNFCGLFEPGDGKAEHIAKTTAMKRLLIMLADVATGRTEATGLGNYDLDIMKNSLKRGNFSSGGYSSF